MIKFFEKLQLSITFGAVNTGDRDDKRSIGDEKQLKTCWMRSLAMLKKMTL
jgi:hypothetical protein